MAEIDKIVASVRKLKSEKKITKQDVGILIEKLMAIEVEGYRLGRHQTTLKL